MTLLLPLLLGLAHGVSDASAGLLVGLLWRSNLPNGVSLILLYNGIAFGFQPVAGLAIDRFNQPRRGAAIGLLCTALGLAASLRSLPAGVILVGLGSAFFHAGGGAVALKAQSGRAGQIGLFAGFGVVGLSLGTLTSAYFSVWTVALFAAALGVIALSVWLWKPGLFSESRLPDADPFIPLAAEMAVLLVLAVAFRSLAWTGVQTSPHELTALQIALAAGTGKLLGGFLADRLGWLAWAVPALAVSLSLLVFGASWGGTVLLGVALLQSLTPLSIAAMGRLMPNSPALASSLTNGLGVMLGGIAFFFLPRGWFTPAILISALLVSAALYAWVLGAKRQI